MGLYNKVIKYLYFRLRKDSGQLPPRDKGRIGDSYAHESVILDETLLQGKNAISEGVVFFGKTEVGYYTTIGKHTMLHGGIISIGNYCQIGPYCSLYALDHPISHLTIYNGKRLFGGRLKRNATYARIDIGHGVWLGHGATILKDCKVGNGAVIGAGAVVTKNIGPYEIAVGSPARIVGKRFGQEIIDGIENSQWWRYGADQLEEFEELFNLNLNQDTAKTRDLLQEFKENLCRKNPMP